MAEIQTDKIHVLTEQEKTVGKMAFTNFLLAVLESGDRGESVNMGKGLISTNVTGNNLVVLYGMGTGMTGLSPEQMYDLSEHPAWREIFPQRGAIPQRSDHTIGFSHPGSTGNVG